VNVLTRYNLLSGIKFLKKKVLGFRSYKSRIKDHARTETRLELVKVLNSKNKIILSSFEIYNSHTYSIGRAFAVESLACLIIVASCFEIF